MAAPTQEYPPWLTPIPSVILDGNGVPITTSTTVMFLPLTYYGPSIPLGPDWTYGGLTSPAPTPTTVSTSLTSAIPSSPTTTAIPSSTTSVSSSSSISTTLSPSTTIPVTSLSISPSTTTPTATTLPNPAGRLTRGQLVGVIVASILGFIFLLVLSLAFYLFCKGKKRRRTRAGGRSIDDDYVNIPPGGRLPGEGSPRHSGEEADPFLRPHKGAGAGGSEKGASGSGAYAEMGGRPPVPPNGAQRVPPPPATIPSLSSTNSSSTGSGYGEPLAKPTLGIKPIREEHEQEMSGGRILTPEEMQRLDTESVLPPDSDPEASQRYSGAYAYADAPNLPPPKLVAAASRATPDYTLPRIPFSKRPSQGSHRSSLPLDVDENATLLTARRVRVEDLGPRSSPASSPTDETSKPSPSSFFGTLGAIAGRLSGRKSQSPRTSQQQPLLESSHLSDQDLEQGRIAPSAPQTRETTASSRGGLGVGLGPDGARPVSSVSGKSQNSGGTIYHDALSSLPATPVLAPLPRVVTPSDAPPLPVLSAQQPTTPAQISQVPSGSARPVDDEHFKNSHPANSPGGTSYAHTLVSDFDILDMPAPSAISLFGGNASAASLKPSMMSDSTVVNNSHADTSLGSLRLYPLPPGLDLIPTPKSWAEMSSGETPSPGSFGGDQENGVGVGITIDVLEEAPPSAGESWRSIAAATAGGDIAEGERLAKRTTFGLPQYVHQPDFTSEQASLYSMRSHLTPTSPPRSTGSAPASTRRDLSYSSNSSRPSAGGSSGALSYAQSLARTGSVTSDGRKRGFGHGPISPALSAFGNQARSGNGSGSGSGSGGDAFLSREGSSASGSGEGAGAGAVLQSPSSAYLAPARVASNSSSPPLSPLSMPWAAGLDDTWSPSS